MDAEDIFLRGEHPDTRTNRQFCEDMGWAKSVTAHKWYPKRAGPYRKRVVCLNNGREYESINKCADDLGLDRKLVGKQILGYIKTHRGFKFERL